MVPLGRRLDYLIMQQEKLMSAIDDLRSAVQAERSVTEGVVRLLQDLNSRLHAAVTSDDMAQVQQIVADLKANTDSLATAVAANTPSDPAGGSNNPPADPGTGPQP